MFDQLGHILAEQRKRRIGDHYVGVVEQRDAFGATEVAIAGERGDHVAVLFQQQLDIAQPDRTVAVEIGHRSYLDLVGRRVLAAARRHPVDVIQTELFAADR